MGDSHQSHAFKIGDLVRDPLLRKPCYRKMAHRTEAAAFAQMRSIERRGLMHQKKPGDSRKGKLVTNVYKCPYCGLWHVGRYQKDTPEE